MISEQEDLQFPNDLGSKDLFSVYFEGCNTFIKGFEDQEDIRLIDSKNELLGSRRTETRQD